MYLNEDAVTVIKYAHRLLTGQYSNRVSLVDVRNPLFKGAQVRVEQAAAQNYPMEVVDADLTEELSSPMFETSVEDARNAFASKGGAGIPLFLQAQMCVPSVRLRFKSDLFYSALLKAIAKNYGLGMNYGDAITVFQHQLNGYSEEDLVGREYETQFQPELE